MAVCVWGEACISASILVQCGAGLLTDHAWTGSVTAAVVVAGALVALLAFGVVQARRMTRLRSAALTQPQNGELQQRVARCARAATILRAGIGLLSLALIALGALLAT